MARKKKVEDKEFDKKLAEVEFPESDERPNKMIDLLQQIVNQNEQVIQLLTKLKERFI